MVSILPLIADIEYFAFFGTLLGLTREGRLLSQDDDVDLYVALSHKDQVIESLGAAGFLISICRRTFVQGTRVFGGVPTYLDFYFYTHSGSHLVEEWNFNGDDGLHLHLPVGISLPAVMTEFVDFSCKMPANPEACCLWTYGCQWRTPMSKGDEYVSTVVNNRPVTILS